MQRSQRRGQCNWKSCPYPSKSAYSALGQETTEIDNRRSLLLGLFFPPLARLAFDLDPQLEYPRLLDRVREVVNLVRSHSAVRADLDRLGVTIYEHAGNAHFVDSHTVEADKGLRLKGEKVILCAGGCSRKLSVPGSELTATHSDAWHLTAIPPTMIVIGAGATGAQVASIFNAFGSKVHLYENGPRILPTEDEDVSAVIAKAFRDSGISVYENFGTIRGFEKSAGGVRMTYSKNGHLGTMKPMSPFWQSVGLLTPRGFISQPQV